MPFALPSSSINPTAHSHHSDDRGSRAGARDVRADEREEGLEEEFARESTTGQRLY